VFCASALERLRLFYEIDLWGRLRRETEAARAALLSTEWGRRAVLVTLVADVARAYFELRQFDLDLEIAKRTFASREKSLRLTQVREEEGVATRLDIRQAENLLYTAAARIPDLERLITQKENEIRLLLALPPGDIRRGLPLTAQPLRQRFPRGSRPPCWSGAPIFGKPRRCWWRPTRKSVQRRRCTFRRFRSPASWDWRVMI
jgi:multidrug efflux system outer membrane protein